MDVMYWTLPHMPGKWSVKAGDKSTLVQGTGPDVKLYHVKRWEGNIPVVSGPTLDEAFDEYRGVPWRELPNSQPVNMLNTVANSSSAPLKEGKEHYAKLPIEPFEYSMKNKLDAMQHTIVKYVTRFRDKGGIRDLKEARNTIDMLIAYEESKNG